MKKPGFLSKLGGVVNRLKMGAAYYGGAYGFYEGTRFSTDRTPIIETPYDADQVNTAFARRQLLGISRSLYANVGFVRGAINDIARYSVGEGIFPYSATPDKAANDAYDAYWRQWCGICEVRQILNWTEILKATSRAVDVDGDIGFIFTETDSGYPQIQAVESHRIESDREDYRDGVKLSTVGRPNAYSVRYTVDGESRFQVYPASQFLHVYEPDRIDGCRGVSGLAHGINHIRDKKDIVAFEKLGVKISSSFGVVITNDGTKSDSGGFLSGRTQTSDGKIREKIGAGAMVEVGIGEDVKAFESNRPSPAFTGFLDYIDRDVAVGLGVPLEFIWDSSKLGGTNQRFVLQKAQRKFDERLDLLSKMTTRVRNWVIAKGIKRGDLKAVDYWWLVDIQGPTKITVDVGREAMANRDDVRSGLRTVQEDFRERGKRWESARVDIQTAADDLIERAGELVAKHKDKGLTLQAAIALMEQRGSGGSSSIIIDGNQPSQQASQ